jgi:hypothetical protein
MSGIDWFPNANNEIHNAAMPGVEKSGRDLLRSVRDNWTTTTRRVKASGRKGPDYYSIVIGSTRSAKLNAHLIEFGGGRHIAEAPTARAARAAGYGIRWQAGGD